MSSIKGGYNAKFIQLPKHLECLICRLGMRNPQQTICGHRACSSCLLTLPRTENRFPCPHCSTSLGDNDLFPDTAIAHSVLDLQVKCDLRCRWKGELRNLDAHSKKCKKGKGAGKQRPVSVPSFPDGRTSKPPQKTVKFRLSLENRYVAQNDAEDEEEGEMQRPLETNKKSVSFRQPECTMAFDRYVGIQNDAGSDYEWFYSEITRKEAENLLADKSDGCFLIRVSERHPGYSLSIRCGDICRHFRIKRSSVGTVQVDGDIYKHKSLEDLVAFHQKNPVMSESGYLVRLKYPCIEGSKATKRLPPHR
eukprot:m.61293 g.61293  ORF g.61293 m.61293 type:complete len:307 (+) comp34992_c0_seq1:54-974(+)